ncbi:hypothetical protein KAS31_04840, partial [Candidatus Parcubacteria bacterium]|nr:hypothetical protein [Candidatus Parcubacteria bacterium]
MKIFAETVSKDPDDPNSEKVNEYDQLTSSNEISGFKTEIEKIVEDKAIDLEISKERLIELAELDLESLSVEDLENSSHIDLEFIRDDINEVINRFQIDKDTKELIIAAPSSIDNLLKFIEKHDKVIKIGELALYISTLGMPAFNTLAEDDVKIEINGQEVLLKDLADDPELTKEVGQELGLSIQGAQETFSEKLADIYEEVKDLPDRNIRYENLDESIEEANRFSDYAELIQNGEKEGIDELVNDLDENGTDVILFGEWHGPESNAVNAVEILEKMQDKDHEIGEIAFEFLSYDDPKAVELVEQFNNGEISAEDFYYSGCLYARSDIRPLLEFAQDNEIPITGIEGGESLSPRDLSRFTEISHRIGEIAEDKEEDEITAVFIGTRHTTESNFNLDDPIISEYKEGRGEIDENDYTIKEYLEESGFNPAAINLDEWKEFAKASDEYFRESYNDLEEEDAKLFGDHCMENWEKYKLDQENTFVVEHNDEKNVYSVVSPSGITEVPPYLNAFKGIEDNHPILKEIMQKQGVFVIQGYDKISLEY